VDASGQLNLSEFQKLVRMLQAKEQEPVYEAFYARDTQKSGTVSKQLALKGLEECGCLDPKGEVPALLPDDITKVGDVSNDTFASQPSLSWSHSRLVTLELVTLQAFLRAAARYRRNARADFRENSGFSHAELQEMRETFDRYDRDGSGDICGKELINIIEDLFPTMAHDPVMRPKLSKMMREIDTDGSGTLDFGDFMRLMQQLQELKMVEPMAKEKKAFKESCFSAKEVEEFRELFLAGDDGGGYLSFPKLVQMLGTIVPMGDKNVTDLTVMVRGLTRRHQDSSGAPPSVDFPEFLQLMKQLLDVDFAGIKTTLGH